MYRFNSVLIKGTRNNGWTYIDVSPEILMELMNPIDFYLRHVDNQPFEPH